MASLPVEPTSTCHVVAMPHPGRGHINPMLNLCKVVAAEAGARILVSFVLTHEWLGFLGSDPRPHNLRFVSIPNVVPSELVRAADMVGFLEAAWTKMEAPFERLLDTELLNPPPTLIIADTYSGWAVGVGNRRNIPVASFWPMSSSMFSYFHHFHLLGQNGHFPINLQEKGDEVVVDYLPGISPTKLAQLSMVNGKNLDLLQRFIKQVTFVPKAQYLLLTTIYELEPQAVDALTPIFPFPIYTVGPAIPYFNLGNNTSSITSDCYFQWLDQQPCASVLYVSLGSYLSASSAQMDELAAGLRDSGVRFLWSVRGEASGLREASGDMGLVVPWCDQLRVLSHSSVGGFLSHCGWSSAREGLFCGVPFLTFPLAVDQYLNGKMIVEDWKVGWRLKKHGGAENVVTCREEIAGLVQRFMDLEGKEGGEMRKRAKQLEEVCQNVVAKGGSSENGICSFISNILKL